jgi:hypothetical protein
MLLAEYTGMKRYLAVLFGVAGLSACSRQPPPHTADDSSWVRPVAAAEPAEKAAELEQALSETPNPWAPPKASEGVAPTSMNKPPPATEPPAAPPMPPSAAPSPDPL